VRTDLFLFGGTAPVPPACWHAPAPLPAWTPLGPEIAVLELPLLRPREPAAQILPSFSVLAEPEHSFQFEAQSPGSRAWTSLSPVGPHVFGATDAPDGRLRPQIDVLVAGPPIEEIRIRVRIHSAALAALTGVPTLVAVSASGGETEPAVAPAGRIALSVPALSQMESPEGVRHRICSPTSVAMVLRYWERPATALDLAAEMFDPRHDLYGVWPAAIRAASRRGVLGYLLRFPSWSAAAWCLARGLPIVASVRYSAGELAGAAIDSTAGHLLVLTGYDGATVLANDPAAPTPREVPRRYQLADIQRVWLERSGVGYVLFPPGQSTEP
jgi:peptidase C39-like protein